MGEVDRFELMGLLDGYGDAEVTYRGVHELSITVDRRKDLMLLSLRGYEFGVNCFAGAVDVLALIRDLDLLIDIINEHETEQ
jgi:uncharacterized protein (DUF488 family)